MPKPFLGHCQGCDDYTTLKVVEGANLCASCRDSNNIRNLRNLCQRAASRLALYQNDEEHRNDCNCNLCVLIKELRRATD